ncbi:ornithine cyclodeaminase family protein [Macrococcus capreoli]|uniref:ornithine cyclodeaminase family protein n=1 Tax=Macrococcus capreoli TaxID=2982690 RepID=UPI0021D5CE6C|nr:ornithine cyclodeaminase family protein [Macrococcus sp. TMW 2.2395]MCU7558438.1 ornithine cyclodeaminase family protein [Macrococcus sp. TMW 2.2395]
MKYYSDQDIEAYYTMQDAIDDVKRVLTDLVQGSIINKERTVIAMPDTKDTMLYMPCVNTNSNYSILKTISIFPNNQQQPVSQGITMLTELETGRHIASLESSYLTRLRTGAMSAIATDYLSRKNAATLAVIGTGGMAFEQVLGVLAVRAITKIYLYNRTEDKAYHFKERLEKQGVECDIIVVDSEAIAVKDADIINCATRSEAAVFRYQDIQPHVHINGVGSYLPEMREIDIEAIEHAKVIVMDDIEGAQHEAGEFIQAAQDGKFSFAQAVALKDIDKVADTRGITIFKSVGAAYYDLAVTVGAYKKLT